MSSIIDFLQVSSRSRINEKILIKDDNLRSIVSGFPAHEAFKNFTDTYKTETADNDLYQQSFLHVISETVCDYPSAFVSEKTFKPIANKRPFVIVGAAGSLANIRNMGFRTFDDFWDEGYDDIESFEQRISAVADVIEFVCGHSIQDLRTLCIRMQDVLNYNFNFYINEFKKTEIKKFKHACIENLNPRYDPD